MNSIWSLESIKVEFEKLGCKLLSEEYKNTHEKLRYIATCGHEHYISYDNLRAGKGLLCKACRYKSNGDKQKLDYDYVREYFKHENCKLISKSYKNNSTKLNYTATCGHENLIAFSKFNDGGGRVCNKCSKAIRYEYDYVSEYFLNNDCLLLESDYVNCKTSMRFIAQCGHEHITTFDAFINSNISKNCRECQKINHYNIESIKELFKNENCILISTDYNYKKPLEYIAQCGHKNTIKIEKFLIGQGRNCFKCNKPKGEHHHNYNASLTQEERIQKRDLFEVIDWRNDVYKRDNFTCQKCGDSKGNNLNAHHISGYNIDIANRFNIENGITLCKLCHDDFHRKNGYGNNTKIQFDKWM